MRSTGLEGASRAEQFREEDTDRARGRRRQCRTETELIGTFWRWPAALFLVATLISLATVLAIAIGNRDANVAPLIWPALFGWITFRYYRSRRLEFDDTVVIVRNFWRTRTFGWSDADTVEIGVRERVYFAPTLLLGNGKQRRIFAGVRRSLRDHGKSVAAVGQWVDVLNAGAGGRGGVPAADTWTDMPQARSKAVA